MVAFLLMGFQSPGGAEEKAAAAATPSNDDCLVCHANVQERTSGPPILPVGEALARSIHGPIDVSCVDCHTDPTAVQVPHPERLPAPTCDKCHEDAVNAYDKSVHAQSRRKTPELHAAACWDCHGKHDMLGVQEPSSPVSHFNLTATCARCHSNPGVIAKAKIKAGDVPAKFRDSIHGQALEKSGLVVAPNCAKCHGHHDIRRAEDKDSRVNRAHVPDTCGACHQGIKAAYAQSVHAAALAKGNPRAAECASCHTAHQAQAVTKAWRLSVVSECGTCHPESLRTFRDSFHGKATRLGFERAATCAACHGAHAVLAKKDPRSSVAYGNLVKTCRRCHAHASANLVKYDPHADSSNRSKNAALYYTSWSTRFLLLGVFGFFGLHTLLWMIRELRSRRRKPSGGPLGEQEQGLASAPASGESLALSGPEFEPTPAPPARDHVVRFARRERLLHLTLLASFLTLALTGVPLLFAEAPWAEKLARLLGGYGVTGKVHRLAALTLAACFVLHVGRLLHRVFIKHEYGLLWGPDSIVPQPRDVSDMLQHFRWFAGLGPRPRFERFAYWQKIDYWAVFSGITIIGLSGLMLWTPGTFSRFLPGWVFNVALVFHGEEALMAMVFIFTVHFFNGHLRPDKFPMDTVIFTGRVSVQDLKRDRPGEYQRLEAEGRLPERLVEAPSTEEVKNGHIIGGVAVTLGLVIAGLAIWTLLR